MIIIQISNSIVHSYLFLTGSLYKEYVVHWRCEEMFLKNVQWMTVYFLLIIKLECGDGELQIKFLFDKKSRSSIFIVIFKEKSINHALEKSVSSKFSISYIRINVFASKFVSFPNSWFKLSYIFNNFFPIIFSKHFQQFMIYTCVKLFFKLMIKTVVCF